MLRCVKSFLVVFVVWGIFLVFYLFKSSSLFERKSAYSADNSHSSTVRYYNLTSLLMSSLLHVTYLNSTKSASDMDLESLYHEDQRTSRFLFLTEKGLQHFATSKTQHKPLWKDEPYLSRRNRLQEECTKLPLANQIDLSRMVYDDNHKVIMCVVPKNACTTWKKYMYYFEGRVADKNSIMEVNSQEVILGHFTTMKTLLKIPKRQALKRLLTYTTFFVTRNPFERLVSAHTSKFTDRAKRNTYKMRIGQKIAMRHAPQYLKGLRYHYQGARKFVLVPDEQFNRLTPDEKKAALRYMQVMNSGAIGFDQMLSYITSQKKSVYDLDVHWRPQATLCNPCAVNYDFVVRFENIVDDSNRLLEFLQRNDPPDKVVAFDETLSSLIDEDRTANAFSEISPDLIEDVRRLYADDFKLMGYSTDVFAANRSAVPPA